MTVVLTDNFLALAASHNTLHASSSKLNSVISLKLILKIFIVENNYFNIRVCTYY